MHRTLWIDRLRCFITVPVVARHASLAYITFACFNTARYLNSTAPVVDNNKRNETKFLEFSFRQRLWHLSCTLFFRHLASMGVIEQSDSCYC